MPAAVTLVRSTYTDADSFNAAAFNALTASSASVPDATPGTAGVMPATTTAAGLALTNAVDAAAQRTVLGLVIGANVQAYNAELAALAGLTGAADRLPYFTGPGAAALATFTSYGRTLAALVDAAAGRTALGLVIGTDVQAYSATLAAFAAGTVLTPAQGGTGVNNASRTLTLAGNVTHAGAFTQSFTATGNTALTLPTTGTLATLAGTEALSNKTITASPISGSTGAFTTVTASGAISTTQAAGGVFSALSGTTGYLAMVLQNTGGTSYFGIENSTGSVFNATPYAAVAYAPNEFDVIIGNVKKAAFTSTGLNSTAIGASTPSTGAFTTLSASGAFLQDFNGAGGNSVNVRFNSSNQRGGIYVNGTSGQPFFGQNLTFSSGSTFNYDKTAGAWAIGDAGGSNSFNFYWAASGTAGTAAMDLSTNTQRVGFYNATGWNLSTALEVNGTGRFTGATLTLGTGFSAAGALDVGFDGNARNGISLTDSTDTSSASFATFRKASGAGIGSITRVTTTDAVILNTNSDLRLKENLRDFTDSGRLIDSLKPRVFDWRNSDENGKNVIGFIAQEEHTADPIFAHIGAVSVGDEDPETITKQWQRSDSALIPILVAELQSLRARVAHLEAA